MPAGQEFVLAGRDDKIHVYDSSSGSHIVSLAGHASDVLFCRVSADRRCAHLPYQQPVIPRDPCKRTICCTCLRLLTMAMLPLLPRYAISGDNSGTVLLWDVDNGECLTRLQVSFLSRLLSTAHRALSRHFCAWAKAHLDANEGGKRQAQPLKQLCTRLKNTSGCAMARACAGSPCSCGVLRHRCGCLPSCDPGSGGPCAPVVPGCAGELCVSARCAA